jgi:type III secretion protein V
MSASVHGVSPGRGSRYSDLLLGLGVMAILAMLIFPLPAVLADGLVAVNIAIGLLLLLVAMYIKSALEFNVFPALLLVTTLFRLALAIATTRLILLDGHAGHIIEAFGRMVAGGNLVVGLVVFIIMTVVQFIVVAKGAERVAEVAARFSLDAMPGKQLSIDSDLRSGLIDKDEARRKRRELEQESKLHGSMDGAMKFVKGDAIAGIVIIVINLLGGLSIGVLQKGMDLSDAMLKYSILTIGDGMVSQIPALLSAMAAGLIVTRAGDDERDRNLGDAIARQLTAHPAVLMLAAGLCVLLAVVPGFPWMVFLLLALVFGVTGALVMPTVNARWQKFSRPAREAITGRKAAAPATLTTTQPVPRTTQPLLLEVPAGAMSGQASSDLVRELERVLDVLNLRLGLPLPRITVHAMLPAQNDPAPPSWRLLAFEVPIAGGALPEQNLTEALGSATLNALRRHTALFFGTQEAGALLARAGKDMPDTVKEVSRALPLQRVAEVLRRLVEEEVAIHNVRDIFEALAEAAQREKDVSALIELTRIALKRQISHQAAPSGRLRAVVLVQELEEEIRKAIRVTNGVQQLALDPNVAREIINALLAAVAANPSAVIVTSVDIRRQVRKLVEQECFDTPVLSFHELMPTLQLEVACRVGISTNKLLEAA